MESETGKEVLPPLSTVIPVVQGDLDAHPQFASLLRTIARDHISPSGASYARERELDAAREKERREQVAHLRVRAVHDAAVAALAASRDAHARSDPAEIAPGPARALEAALHAAHARTMCGFIDPATGLRIHGVRGRDLDPAAAAAQALPRSPPGATSDAAAGDAGEVSFPGAAEDAAALREASRAACPAIEDRLRATVDALGSFLEADRAEDDGGPRDPSAVARRVAELAASLPELRRAAVERRMRQQVEYWGCLGVQSEVVSVLLQIAERHKGGVRYEADVVLSEWLMSRARTMSLKLAVLKQQLLRDTYTPRTVAALRVIHEKLEEAFHEATQQLRDAEDRIASYDEAGPGFEKLVKEYTSLLEELKDKEWALRELQDAEANAQL